MSLNGRIDVHQHFLPPKFDVECREHGNAEWTVPDWSSSASLELMSKLDITTAILSVTSPGVDVVPDLETQAAISRDANITGSELAASHPSQFGFFATIPNPAEYLSAALAEIEYAFDTLHADGVTLVTSYSGRYLGHESLRPLWAELDRRHAVVFIHPTSPPAPYTPISKSLLPPVLDFTFETTRTAADLIMSGTKAAFPNVKIILSHGGGTLPWSWHRLANLPKSMSMTDVTFEDIKDAAQSFYFDTALTGEARNVESLLQFAKPGRVLYGSDFPYAPSGLIGEMTEGLDAVIGREGMEKEKRSASFEVGLELFPRLRQYYESEK